MADVRSAISEGDSSNSGISLATLLLNAAGTTTTSKPSANALSNSDNVLSTAMGKVTDTAQYNELVQNILTQSAISFAPTLASGFGGSGLYNSSTVKLLQDNARASATAQSAGAVLTAQQQALNTAAQVSNGQLSASKTQMQTSNLLGSAATLLPTAIASAIVSKTAGSAVMNAAGTVGTAIKDAWRIANVNNPGAALDATGGELPASVAEALGGMSATPLGDAPMAGAWVDTGLGTSATISSAALGTEAGGAFEAAMGIDQVAALSGIGAAAEGGAMSAAVGGMEVGSLMETAGAASAAAEAAGIIGGAAEVGGAMSAAEAGMAVGSMVEGVGLAEGAAAATTAAEGAGLGEAIMTAVAAWVICTELNAQGKLEDKLYQAGGQRALTLPADVLRGYHWWAIPYTKLMRKSKLATAFIRPLAIARNKYILGEKNFLGLLSVKLGEPLCGWVGRRVVAVESWQSLYAGLEQKGL